MKIKFNKLCVCWVLLVTTTYAFYVVFTGAIPPDSVTYSLFAINGLELIMTTRIYINGESLSDKIKEFLNMDNAEAIAEKILDVDLKRSKNGNKKRNS